MKYDCAIFANIYTRSLCDIWDLDIIWQAAVMIEYNNVIVQFLGDNCAIKY